jgi:DNA-binding transcriptional LysR family regulator
MLSSKKAKGQSENLASTLSAQSEATDVTASAPRSRIRHLEVFWAVMRLGSQHKAAELLGMSQPAVSQLIRYIEIRFGLQLFARVKGRLIPTPEAQQLFKSVDEVMSRVADVERFARDLKRGIFGRLMLATVPGLSSSLLPEVLGTFIGKHKDTRVALKTLPTQVVIERVVNGQVDLGFVYGPIDAIAAEVIPIGQTEIVCVLPRTHALASCPYLEPKDLAEFPLITGSINPRWCQLVEEAFTTKGVERNVVCECSSSDLAYTMAANGAGVAVVPMIPLKRAHEKDLVVLQFRPQIALSVLALHSATVPLDKPALALIQWLKQASVDFQWQIGENKRKQK